MSLDAFNPNACAVKNGNLVGLPFNEENAQTIILPVPWEATVSYSPGTAKAAACILEASYQLDLYNEDYPNAWQKGIFFMPVAEDIKTLNKTTRTQAANYIDALENQKPLDNQLLQSVNEASEFVNDWVYNIQTIAKGKSVILLGGEHSTPFGYIKALAEIHDSFAFYKLMPIAI